MTTRTTLQHRRVMVGTFLAAYRVAHATSARIADACTAPDDLPRADVAWHLATDGLSGFGVTSEGELIAVWSVTRGRGDDLVTAALEAGAWRLDCFDGYLPTLYGRHGFREYLREPNWTPGGPDVVYMMRDLVPDWASN